MLLSLVVTVSLAALLISEDSSVGDFGNDVCIVSKSPGAPAKDHIFTRILNSQKGCPHRGCSCSREKTGESVHEL